MKLKLLRPLCFFDLETTGVNVTHDRIVEIAILKLYPDGTKENKVWRVNPECPIPAQASAVHGIYNADVTNEPNFKALSKTIHSFIKNSDLAGYNSDRFDIPLLAEEMLRAEIDFNMADFKTVDVQTIFHKMEQRTLTAAYKFYCDKNLENAHSAEADTIATYEVLKAQLDRYDALENDTKFLAQFSTRQKFADFAGFIRFDEDGDECFSFGKHKGKKVTEVLQKEPGYFGWLLDADFPLFTKKVLTAIKLRAFNQKLF